jgi:phospholipid transport system substrate-binding protein
VLNKLLRSLLITAGALAMGLAQAQATPDALVKRISTEVIDTAKADKAIQDGDVNKIIALVDAKVMPSVNFEVVTRSAVGPKWREASPEQRTRLQAEFKSLLVRV